MTKLFDDAYGEFDAASKKAAEIVRRIKSTNDYKIVTELFKELKECDKRRHHAIDVMEQAFGHH